MRISKDEYYLNIALAVAQRGTCLRRNYGAVIVKNDMIVGTGYSGSVRGHPNCCDVGTCKRQELGIPSGERYELCCSVHSEANAIMSAGRERCIGAEIFIAGIEMETGLICDTTKPCDMCKRLIDNAGIISTIVLTTNGSKVIDCIG